MPPGRLWDNTTKRVMLDNEMVVIGFLRGAKYGSLLDQDRVRVNSQAMDTHISG
jgi:hypothetical protein